MLVSDFLVLVAFNAWTVLNVLDASLSPVVIFMRRDKWKRRLNLVNTRASTFTGCHGFICKPVECFRFALWHLPAF